MDLVGPWLNSEHQSSRLAVQWLLMVELRLTQPPLGVLCYPWYTSLVRGWFFETEIVRAVLAADRFPFPGEQRLCAKVPPTFRGLDSNHRKSGRQKRQQEVLPACLPFVPLKREFLAMIICFLFFYSFDNLLRSSLE